MSDISVYVAANRVVTTVKEIIPQVSQVCHLHMVSKFHVAAIMYKEMFQRNSTSMSGSKYLPLLIKLQLAGSLLSLIKKTISYDCTLAICNSSSSSSSISISSGSSSSSNSLVLVLEW